MEQVTIPEDEFSYALGRNGSTRKKLAAAANCILQYLGNVAVFAGSPREVRLCQEYLDWLLRQRVGPVDVDYESRDDCIAVDVPSEYVGFVTGAQGASLREMEFMSRTFMFSAGDRSDRSKPVEKLLVFGAVEEGRRYGAVSFNIIIIYLLFSFSSFCFFFFVIMIHPFTTKLWLFCCRTLFAIVSS